MLPTALLVDDHDSWRRQIRSLLEITGEWQVAGEAANGPDGVRLAASLRPAVTLLDVDLPEMNGVQAATRILESDPAARILFLSSHRSWEVVEAALLSGARGFVHKLYAAEDLLPAMQAVDAGRRFVSALFGGRPWDARESRPRPHCHEAGFYLSDEALTAEYEQFAASALAAGKSVIGVTAAARRQDLDRRLRSRGIDLDRAIADGRYLALDVDDLLPPLMVNGMPDESRFWKGATALAFRAARASRQDPPAIAAFGDGTQSLWLAGRGDAAVRLEQLWEEFARTFNADIFCGYAMPGGVVEDEFYQGVCAAHSATHRR